MQKLKGFISVAIIVFLIASCGEEGEENIYGDYGDNSNVTNDDNKPDEYDTKPDADTIVINDSEPDDPADNDTEVSDEEKVDKYKDMVLIPQGLAWVGCNENIETDCPAAELPYHKVSTKAYYIDKFEVTVDDFKKCIQAKACGEEEFAYNTVKRNPYCNLGARNSHPMNCVSYFGAQAYCLWVGKRLPGEGEWEKAARGGCEIHGNDNCEEKSYIYTWGSEGDPDCSKVNMAVDAADWGCGSDSTAVGGSYEAGKSPYGAYDMLGNLYEWVDDKWSDNHDGAKPDGSSRGVATGEGTVKGGGFMQKDKSQFRISYRARQYTEEILYSRGFRCVADIED
jgi:formylglycine-generating enzyme required for sulfatase activity